MPSKFYLETYGCSLNMADSDLIVGRLHHIGLERADSISGSDFIILNSCGVKEPTEDRIIHRLEELSANSRPVIVAGCLPRISLDRLITAIPGYAAILGPQSLDSLGPVVERVLSGERGILNLDSDEGSKLSYYEGPSDSVICTIPICEGCVGECAYCAVKFARSNVRSYSIEEIRRIVERCIHLGYKEIRLTAQDAGAFGHDTGESLTTLLEQVKLIEGTHRFRLGMFNPNLVLNELAALIDIMSSERFFQFFHVPLQSGSNNILDSMQRRYTVEQWIDVVRDIRKHIPDATIATDIIVGYPGETEDDFEKTLEVLKEVHPSVINVSKYGDRPGTLASKANNKVNTDIKKNRSRRLSQLANDIITSENQKWIGWQGPVIITGLASRKGLQGRTPTYKSVIIEGSSAIGSIVQMRVTGAYRTHLTGVIL
ncbi:MAG: tRNA (N(6)-L-threonylcarbamoyladenosine(37)-C(2))-methylthiotransferase [Candidatus Thorarchaeota archaeon]